MTPHILIHQGDWLRVQYDTPPGEKNFWGLYPNVSIKIETYPFLFETFSQAQFTIINAFERETHSKYVNTTAKQTSISVPSIHP